MVLGRNGLESQGTPRLHGSTDLYGHPNSYSGMAVGCLPFIYFLYPVCRRYWQKVLLLALLLCCFIIIIFTGSRTGYVATLLLLLFALIKLKGKHRRPLIIMCALILPASILTLPDEYLERFKSIYTLEDTEGGSISARLQIIDDSIDIAAAKPWGVGVAAFPTVRQEIFGRSQDTHNLYLELLTNLSVIGLFAFIILIKSIISNNLKIQSELQNIDSHDAKFVIALSKAIIAFILARLFLGLFGMDTYEIYWWFAIGVTISLYRCKELILKINQKQALEVPKK